MNLVSFLAGSAKLIQATCADLQSAQTRFEKHHQQEMRDAKAEDEKFYDEQRRHNVAKQQAYEASLTDSDRRQMRENAVVRAALIEEQKQIDYATPYKPAKKS